MDKQIIDIGRVWVDEEGLPLKPAISLAIAFNADNLGGQCVITEVVLTLAELKALVSNLEEWAGDGGE